MAVFGIWKRKEHIKNLNIYRQKNGINTQNINGREKEQFSNFTRLLLYFFLKKYIHCFFLLTPEILRVFHLVCFEQVTVY